MPRNENVSALAMLYVIALIVGGGLLFLSVLLGSDGNADFHADVSNPAGLDAHGPGDLHSGTDAGHGMSLASWFSLQFAVYFLAIFGLVGTAMTYVAKARPGVVLAAALASGIVVGQLVHQAIRALKRSSVGSDLHTEDYVKRPARVTIAIDPPRRGEVAIASRNGERFLAAVSRRGDDRFKVGDHVVVVAFQQGVAEVVSREEFEFVSSGRSGETS